MSNHIQAEPVIKLKWLDSKGRRDLHIPAYTTAGSSGMDVRAALDRDIAVEPGDIVLVPSGFAVEIPPGYEVQVRPRSGLGIKHGITVVNAPGTIDSDYRGEIKIGLINLGRNRFTIRRGDRIAQLVVSPVARARLEEVDRLDPSTRDSGGFGHTGVR
ncbi:MAG: dUTP diphosphatase [Desulfocapsaceae bacterium]|jgi:dUTP pyrophosphatase|nr:dUTP diphosphatase [Desulfocapsaceae bacterium]